MPLAKEQEAARERIKKRRYRKVARSLRAYHRAKKPKGVWNGGNKFDLARCMEEYSKEFDDIVDMTISTLRSQTVLSHPKKDIAHLSKRLIYLYGNRGQPMFVEREEVEQELKVIWARCYRRCREKGWSLKNNFLKYAAWFLPFVIGNHITCMRGYTDDRTYDLDLTEKFNIDLDYIFNGSNVWPASIFSTRERYIIFLLQEYPGEYTTISRLSRIPLATLRDTIDEIRNRLTKELDINASTYTTGSSERGTNDASEGHIRNTSPSWNRESSSQE